MNTILLQKIIPYLKLHPLLYRAVSVVVALLGLLLTLFLYVALVGISIDASGQRDKITTLLSESLGREVKLEGAMSLEISAHPKLKLGGFSIANADGFSENSLVTLGEANLALDLWPLLWLRYQIEELSGKDVRIRLEVKQNGKNNWTFKSAKPKKNESLASAPVAEQAAKAGLGVVLSRLDIKRIALKQLDVEFVGANSKIHYFELQSLEAHLPAGQPITLALHGKIEKKHPYQLSFTGGSITDLAELDDPWPFDLKLDFMSSQLSLKGAVSDEAGTINFSLGTKNLAEFEQLLQTRLPPVGAANISGAVKYTPGKVALDNLSGHMGKTDLKGALKFDYGSDRPRVDGELVLPVLDLRPFMSDKPVEDKAPPKSLAEMYREISKATFSLKALNAMDADLTLRVGQWINLPGAVHDAQLQVKLERGRLAVPMEIIMAEVKLAGSMKVDARLSTPKFSLVLGTHDSGIGNLAGLLLGVPDVKGRLARFDFRIAARGDDGAELMDSLDVQMNVADGKLSYGNAEGERPVQFSLDKFELALPAGKALRGELKGSLLDKNFSAVLRGSPLKALAQDIPAPVVFDMKAGSASISVSALLQASAQSSTSDITFEVVAPHSGEIASWLGLKPGADAPINLSGRFVAESGSWHLSGMNLKLGRSDLSVDMLRTLELGKPLIKFGLKAELLDAEQLQSLLPETNKSDTATKKKSATKKESAAVNMMDIPILPSGVSLSDADIVVSIKNITSASPVVVRDIGFTGKIRDGMMPTSPFSANVADNDFKGDIFIDLRTQQPHFAIKVDAADLDVGGILKKVGIAGNFDSAIDHLSLRLDLHSSRLGELLAKSEISASLEGGYITLADANTGGKMRIALEHGEIKSAPGAPIFLDLRGSLNGAPVSIGISTTSAVDLVNPNLPLPFSFKANTSGAMIKLSGDIARPFTKKDIELALDMGGSRFDNLNALAQTSLPPWGPWSASGKFKMSAKGYEISSLRLQVGSSHLAGYGKFDTKVVPPRIDIALSAPSIQLDDFRFGDWSLEKAKPAGKAKQAADAPGEKNVKTNKQAQQILSSEVLSRQNAYLTVKVDQVVSGQDLLGGGKLEAKLEGGRAALGPVVVNTPGGSASFSMKYEPGKKDVLVSLRAEAKNFDYGILARRIDKKSEMKGTFSLDVDVNARAEYLSDIFKSGKGHIDFAVWPENLKSGLLDVWAVNVLMALLPAVDSSKQSKVNCAVGRFVLANGKLSEKSFLIDTSRMRVTGKGGVDFNTEKIQLYVEPHAKTPQFLSLAIPIEVSGKLDDFSVGVRATDVVGTVGQFITSVIWVPLKMLFGKEAPADGLDVCGAQALK